LDDYKRVAEAVARIWKEHGALDYFEYTGDDLTLEGTMSFTGAIGASADESIMFGKVAFESKAARDLANDRVAADPRMKDLMEPLLNSSRVIFDAKRMVYGGFQLFIQSA